MKHLSTKTFLIILLTMVACTPSDKIMIEVYPDRLSEISPLLFGQFMERARPEEPGPDASLKPDNTLTDDVVALLREMNIPIIRYYGGYLIEWGQEDWTQIIDNAPGHGPIRKDSPSLGYNEYLNLAEEIGSESVIPVHFRKAILKQMPLEEAVMQAAGLVAYINAPVGAKLLDGMPDWPAIRAKNGRTEPWGVKYFQIGNEWPTFTRNLAESGFFETTQEMSDWFKHCIIAYSTAMKAIDPSIKIIADALTWSGRDREIFEPLMASDDLRGHVDYFTIHEYRPWELNHFMLYEDTVKVTDLTDEQKWYAALSVPNMNEEGLSAFDIPAIKWAEQYNWPLIMTEWNWNGFNSNDSLLESRFMKGIGAAGFLHGIFRLSHNLHLANQSMLVGTNWELNSIRVYPGTNLPALMFPTGQITAFYNHNHGPYRLLTETRNIPVIEQPVSAGNIRPKEKLALLDVETTGDDNTVYVHIINRHFTDDMTVDIAMRRFGTGKFTAELLSFEGTLENSNTQPMAWINFTPVEVSRGRATVTLPARSVNILKIEER